MMSEIRIFILMPLLFIGAYATYVADRQVKEFSVSRNEIPHVKNALDENDYTFMEMALTPDNSGSEHEHVITSGSLIVKGEQIIGAGWDELNSSNDPTDHATLKAVKEATIHLGTTSLKGSVIYAGIQPCPMCLSLLYLTKIDKIIYFEGSDTANLTDNELLNRQVYRALIKNPSERVIPEIVLHQKDLQ